MVDELFWVLVLFGDFLLISSVLGVMVGLV